MKRGSNSTRVAMLTLCFGAALSAVANASWTTNDTEVVWSGLAHKAVRISTAPRLKEADAEVGEGILEAFGTKYLPNAFALYQARRESAKEKEVALKENFPNGRESDSTGGKLYDKIAGAVAKAVFEMDRRHDELCHYFLLHKAGVVTEAELANVDSARICIMLSDMKHVEADAKPSAHLVGSRVPRDRGRAGRVSLSGSANTSMEKVKEEEAKTPTEAERTFAGKYLPLAFAAYGRLSNAATDGNREYSSLLKESAKIDAAYGNMVLMPLFARMQEIQKMLNKLADTMKQQKLLHAVEEVTAAQLAELDEKLAKEILVFEKRIPVRDYVLAWLEAHWTEKDWLVAKRRFAPLASFASDMVAIPGKDYKMHKYEVTQALWQFVMGDNPSRFKGDDLPVECISWDDCQKFLEKLNEMPEVKKSGLIFRLPTQKEWEYACRAGSAGGYRYCKLADGTEITPYTLGEVAWVKYNSSEKTHPVGQKKPNAFGLYDMYGNVCEWTQTADGRSGHVFCCGGGWTHDYVPSYRTSFRRSSLGFRLCASGRADEVP